MDSIQAIVGLETVEEEIRDVSDAQEEETLTPEAGSTTEMDELPVEDWDYQEPKRGQVRTGVILAIRDQEIIVDVGAKRDGIVPYSDIQRLSDEVVEGLAVGDEVPVYILRPEDQEGNLLVSLNMAMQERAWQRAKELADSGEVFEDEVIGFNKGGLVLPVGEIRGFIPASQVPGFPHGLNHEERLQRLSDMVGQKLTVKVIEIDRRKRRLILSATAARRQWRKVQRKRLLEDLREGEVREGVVSSLASFGAFVDLGGADGLIHISELSWRRVRHPKEVLRVGEEVEVYVLRLDHERKRIGLSLKRLQPEPWALVEDKYELGQLVEGVVTNVVDFGAFAEIEEGVEGLIHISELAEGQIAHPRDVVKKGDLLLLRIIRIDARRKRLGLSLKRVLESEWAEWAARLAVAEEAKEAQRKKEAPPEQAAVEVEVEEPVAVVADDVAPESTAEEAVGQAEVEEPVAVVADDVAPESAAEEAVGQAEVEEPVAVVAEGAETEIAAEVVEEPLLEGEDEPAAPKAKVPPEEVGGEAEVESPVAVVADDAEAESTVEKVEEPEPGAEPEPVVSEEPQSPELVSELDATAEVPPADMEEQPEPVDVPEETGVEEETVKDPELAMVEA